MNESFADNFGRLHSLNVAVSTDTVLYIPFFLGYYSGEFESTPFGRYSVNIIGTHDDERFIQPVKLKGDGFASFCLIFGLADAAICDPSFLVYFSKAESEEIKKEFEKFEKLLKEDTKELLAENFSSILELNNKKLSIISPEDLKNLFNKRKILGGIIRKIAFSIVCSSDLRDKLQYYINDNYLFSNDFKRDGNTQSFTKTEVTNSFIYYPSPSTGYCIGEINKSKYNKENKRKYRDFGQELGELVNSQTQKSIAITCDFIALDYLRKNNQRNSPHKKNVIEIQDLTNSDKNYLFTAVLGYETKYDDEKLRALLWVIDKNLFFINKYLYNKDTTGLLKYFRRKFNYSSDKENELLKLLIADDSVRTDIQYKIDSKDEPDFDFNQILRYYVSRLNTWYRKNKNRSKTQSLYYDTCFSNDMKDSLYNITNVRYEAINKRNQLPSKDSFSTFIGSDLLSEWKKTENQYWKFENMINEKNSIPKLSDILVFLFSPFLIINRKWKSYLFNRIWTYLRKPTYLYLIGSFFILFEIITGISHVFYKHIPNWKLPIPWFIRHTILQDGTIAETAYQLPISLIIFWFLIISFSVFFYHARNLQKLKQEEHFMYRNEEY